MNVGRRRSSLLWGAPLFLPEWVRPWLLSPLDISLQVSCFLVLLVQSDTGDRSGSLQASCCELPHSWPRSCGILFLWSCEDHRSPCIIRHVLSMGSAPLESPNHCLHLPHAPLTHHVGMKPEVLLRSWHCGVWPFKPLESWTKLSSYFIKHQFWVFCYSNRKLRWLPFSFILF